MTLSLSHRKTPTLNRNMPDLKDYITTEEAAEVLGFHIEHIRRMLRAGNLEGLKVGYMWFVSEKSLADYQKRTAKYSKHDPHKGE